MGARLRVFLSAAKERPLFELRPATTRRAKLQLEQTGRVWVVVRDNGSAHTSKLVLS